MDWIAISLGLITAAITIGYITHPWWARHRDPKATPESVAHPSLVDQRETTVSALRDLDFDRAVGKITDEDYVSLRQNLLAETAAIMTRLEQEQAAAQATIDARIKAEISEMRQPLNNGQLSCAPFSAEHDRICPACSREPLPGDLYCRGCGTQLARACPQCGEIATPTGNFCVSCGFEMALAVAG